MPPKSYGKRKSPSTIKGGIKRQRRPAGRYTRFRKGSARPMRALRTGYRGVPNQYRFVREAPAAVIDLHDYITTSGATHDEIAVVRLENVPFDILGASAVSEFSNLFSNYKLDKIEIRLRPLWQMSDQNTYGAAFTTTNVLPNLRITRINTKYMTEDLVLGNTNGDIRDKLAQIQMKSETTYARTRPLTIATWNPRVYEEVLDANDTTNSTTVARAAPWLSLKNGTNVKFSHNELLVAQRLDHGAIPNDYYKYEYVVKLHFRCSMVV